MCVFPPVLLLSFLGRVPIPLGLLFFLFLPKNSRIGFKSNPGVFFRTPFLQIVDFLFIGAFWSPLSTRDGWRHGGTAISFFF